MNKQNQKPLYWQDAATRSLLEQSLKEGHCSITSTDTILGLLAPLTEQGFVNLNVIKGGRQNKPYLILISSPEKLKLFVDRATMHDKVRNLVAYGWPGPVTLIFKARPDLPKYLVSDLGTIAIRCPQHAGLLELLKSFDGLFSTSANKSGQLPPQQIDQIDDTVIELVDYVVVDVIDKDSMPQAYVPSTILDVSDGQTIKVVREGAFPVAQLDDF